MRHNTNWKKTLKDPSEFVSNWDWCQAHSEYHFDDGVQDQLGYWFDVLGVFRTDCKSEVGQLVKNSKPINWQTRKYYGDTDAESPMLTQEEYDIAAGGGDPKKLMLTNMLDDLTEYPMLYKMADYFGLEAGEGEIKKRVHVQLTGQMFNYHIDKLWDRCPEDPERVARITIMLEDWKPGQFYMYGNYVYDRWQAGEAHIFDWANVPHATANASNHPRPTIQITGLKTDRTREIIANAGRNTIFDLDA